MISQLQKLETTLLELKERYHITRTELVSLKQRLAQDDASAQIINLNKNLETANQQITTLTQQTDELIAEKTQLEQQIIALKNENAQLDAKNRELEDKHALAVQRVEVITNWLTNIDNGTI